MEFNMSKDIKRQLIGKINSGLSSFWNFLKSGPTIFKVILIALSSLSVIPIIILISQSISSLNSSKELSNNTIESTIKEQTTQVYQSYAQNLARRISDFLYSCESDLHSLSAIPASSESYQQFGKNNLRWVNFYSKNIPLYKELVLIDESGNEKIKIINGEIIPNYLLKNVIDKKNTKYLSETYFEDTKRQSGDIYVSHLTSWYISRYEQLEKNKQLDGVVRFCKKIKDGNGNFKGIIMIALDAAHLLDFVDFKIMSRDSLANRYRAGSYNYIIDDQGWIIAHQKLWDIKGFDKDGNQVKELSPNTPKWKYDTGIMPINLTKMDWKLIDIYSNEPMSSIIERVRRGETCITTVKSMGIYSEVEGIIRTRTYAPIYYSTGDYNKYGIFGAVSVGTSLKKFMDKSRSLVEHLEEINEKAKQEMIFVALLISLGVIFFSFLIAKWIAKPLMELSLSLSKIGRAEYIINNINSPIKEINILSRGVKKLASELEEKDNKINQTVKELGSVNINLAATKKELSAYLHHEYEIETDFILEEKIKTYENEYPLLKEIRKEKIIGNSPQFLRVLRQIVPQSQMNLPTCIYGETGTGKSALAFQIHRLSPRRDKPFMIFEAAEFSASDPLIVMGKIFGYGEGHGIQGIDKSGQLGIIELCNGGTLLIDDVDSLPLDTQAQILRIVDGLSFHPAAGKPRDIISDVRFLFSTHVDLESRVKEGFFRKDLFRRIGGSFNKIVIPSLRERRTDILLLAEHFIKRFNKKNDTSIELSQISRNFLFEHDFKEGNIGELKTMIEVAYENARIEGSSIIDNKFLFETKSREAKSSFSIKDNNSKTNNIIVEEKNIFTADELNKLRTLRENNFRMDLSEDDLGYKKGSHTLSHHLKGICYKTLCNYKFNIRISAKIITGSDDPQIIDILVPKIEGYISNIKGKENSLNINSLFKNLPKEYHEYLEQIISKKEIL
jgi:transcriptional regulator with PAS, ATPase and Fis domain